MPSHRFSKHLTPIDKPPSPDAMTPDELLEVLGALGLSISAAARLLGVNDRTVRRWSAGDAPLPPPATRFLRYLHRAKISPQKVMETLSR
jgi:DNA-binding transcriptional regulator YiaG